MNRLLALAGVLLSSMMVMAQQAPIHADSTHFTPIKEIVVDAKDIQTDRLGHLFVVSQTNQLYKYSADGQLLSTLNYKYIGNISHVDATNPMEIYVFYKELNLVVFLDNNLAYRGEMKLDQYGIGQASAAARSFDNGVWVFDLTDLQLKKMDKNGENVQASGNIRQFTSRKKVNPTYLFDDNNRVLLNDSSIGVMVFDVFAHYLKTIPILGCTEVKLIGDELYYYASGQIRKYNLKSLQTTAYKLPPASEILDLSIEKGRIYLLQKSRIGIYAF